jgi:8-oxo-dGTP pyrophosphatase MutT (NUDIX family)
LFMAKSVRSGDIQYGVLPYRMGDERAEVMLLTSRGTGRWVIPKGWPMACRKPRDVAIIEARQEAGIWGIVGRRPIGSFSYAKTMNSGEDRLCECVVYLMLVTNQSPTWREQAQRRRAWFPRDIAAEVVHEGALAFIIRNLLDVPRKAIPVAMIGAL